MNKFGQKKIAIALACASFLGNKTSAMTVSPNHLSSGVAKNDVRKLDKNKGMCIGKKVGILALLLAGTYVFTNEVLGDTGLVNHPMLGKYTFKKAIDYFGKVIKKDDKAPLNYKHLNPKVQKGNYVNDKNDKFKQPLNNEVFNVNLKKDELEQNAKSNINHIKEKIAKRASDEFEDVNGNFTYKEVNTIVGRLKNQMLNYQNINIIIATDNKKKICYKTVNYEKVEENYNKDYSIKPLDNENKKEFVDIIKIFSGVFTGELSLGKEEFEFRNAFAPTIVIKKEGKYYNMWFELDNSMVHFSELVNNEVTRYVRCTY